MCQDRGVKKVKVKIATDLNDNGKEHWRDEGIDKCIAPIVKALQEGGIDMRTSCCGHGRPLGEIRLQDGRILLIDPKGEWATHRYRLLLHAMWIHFIYPKKVYLRVKWMNFTWRLKNVVRRKRPIPFVAPYLEDIPYLWNAQDQLSSPEILEPRKKAE